jgi:hypothetical protein
MGGQWNASLLQQGCKYIVIDDVPLSDLDMRVKNGLGDR